MSLEDEEEEGLTPREMMEDRADIGIRLFGVLIALGGLFFGYQYLYAPLQAAQARAEHISYSLKGAGFAPAFFLGGLMLVAFGRHQETVFGLGRDQQPTKLGYAFLIALAVIGFATAAWFSVTISGLGYTNDR